MLKQIEGSLAWYRVALEARRSAFTKMVDDPALSAEQRSLWAERLIEVEVVLADIEADSLGYMAWMLGEGHSALRKQTDRFPQ